MTRLLSNRRSTLLIITLAGLALYELAMAAGGDDSSHGGSVLNLLLELIVILLAAKLGGDLFERISQPAVLGELIIGMLIGNAQLVGITMFQSFGSNLTLEILSEIGVIILLFEVGLESTVREMRQVGLTSLLVATLGVIAPFILGWGVSIIFLPNESEFVHAFIGATLCATSVGITARVLKDIGKTSTRESRIILGAAVIDDVLGLVILAIVTGIITSVSSGAGGLEISSVIWIVSKALLFVVGAIVIGQWLLPHYFRLAFKIRGKGVFLSFALLVCFGLAYIAGKIGLAPIVGAFAAGLIYDRVEYQEFEKREKHTMEELIAPIAIFLVPIFFVRMGMLVDLTTFANIEILGFAAVLTAVAIIGKQACSLGIWDKQTNRIAVGLGMIPRGEVGLIFAGIGAKLMYDGHPVIAASTYSAVVIMVIVTTLVTPPLLKWSMLRRSSKI